MMPEGARDVITRSHGESSVAGGTRFARTKDRLALALPALTWFALFVLGPVALVGLVSFARRGTYGGIEWTLNFENYARLVDSSMVRIFADSLWMATGTALTCVSLGLLAAWGMATASPGARRGLLALIALPFLTNLIIRIYAIKLFVGADGPLQNLLTWMGMTFDPFEFTANSALVWYGLISSYLPFAILPLYGAFEKFDFALVEAAQDLGAGDRRVLTAVVIPALRVPLAASFVLVFVPCLGEFLIPDLLGGAKVLLAGNLITEKFLRLRDWPSGSAVAITMMLGLGLVLWLASKVLNRTPRGAR